MDRSVFSLSQSLRVLVAIALVAIAVAITLPHYFTGNWSWMTPEPNFAPLIELRQTGLTVPGWRTQTQQKVILGGHSWSLQAIAPLEPKTAVLTIPNRITHSPYLILLRPQMSQTDQPQVEWTDIDGVQSWTIDQQQHLRFVVKPSGIMPAGLEHSFKSTARFFRGRNSVQTYAVLQWYAWANGGSPTPARWFVADQLAQWRARHPLSWVAVCLLIPLDPLADIASVESVASQLGQAIHAELAAMLIRVDSLPLTPTP
jgi:cyanoexosortase B-associated protein